MKFRKFAVLLFMVTVMAAFSAEAVSASASSLDDANVIDVSDYVLESTEVSSEKVTITSDVKVKDVKKKKTYSKGELRLMASIINCEAGGESYQGKLAVAIVVMNRVKSKSFPNTIKGVIYQKNQFSPVRNGSLRRKLSEYNRGKTGSAQWKSCIKAAKKVLEGQRTIVYKGKVKNMKSYHFFSVYMTGARFKLGGHRFK